MTKTPRRTNHAHRSSDARDFTPATPAGARQTELEIAAGREAVKRHSLRPAAPRSRTHNVQLGILKGSRRAFDPAVKLPANILTSISRVEEAFKNQIAPMGAPRMADKSTP